MTAFNKIITLKNLSIQKHLTRLLNLNNSDAKLN